MENLLALLGLIAILGSFFGWPILLIIFFVTTFKKKDILTRILIIEAEFIFIAIIFQILLLGAKYLPNGDYLDTNMFTPKHLLIFVGLSILFISINELLLFLLNKFKEIISIPNKTDFCKKLIKEFYSKIKNIAKILNP